MSRHGRFQARSLKAARAGHFAAPEATSVDLEKFSRLLKAWGEVLAHGAVEPWSGNLADRAQKASKAVLPRSQRAADSPLARLVRIGQQLPGLHPDGRVATVTTARGLLAELDGVSLAPSADAAPVTALGAEPSRRPRADIDDLRVFEGESEGEGA